MRRRKFRLKKGGNDMMNKKFRPLNVNKLNAKKSTIVSSEEALKDISPINWSKEVLSGQKKVLINFSK